MAEMNKKNVQMDQDEVRWTKIEIICMHTTLKNKIKI